ncbi:MAG TPA: hypothetical protein VFC00_15580 [Micromonosporaceae bacterium]|nr:hypothetical protein [Micromonosporaceae bacterium]
MPFPASVTTVTVHMALLDGQGQPFAGQVMWVIPQVLRDVTGNIVITPGAHIAELDADGEASITLPTTDDPDLAPQDWTYDVVISGTGMRSQAMRIQLPVALGAGPVEFSDLATVEDPPDVIAYLPIVGGTLTGPLVLSGAPTQALHAATKAYVDAGAGGISPTILDAKGDLLAASAADAPARVAVGSNGQVLTADSTQAAGVRWATPSAGDGGALYPPEGYGLKAMSADPTHHQGSAGIGSDTIWATRLWIPAGVAIANLYVAVRAGGTHNGATAGNQLGLYDDTGAQVDTTASDNTLWTAAGWRGGALQGGAVAAQGAGRFVYVLWITRGLTVNVSIPYPSSADDANAVYASTGVGGGNRRAMYAAGASLPASFDPTSYGTSTGFLSLVGVS